MYIFVGRILEDVWEFAQKCVLWTWKRHSTVSLGGSCGQVLREYGVSGPLIQAVHSLCNWNQSLVRIAAIKSNSFLVRRGCPL